LPTSFSQFIFEVACTFAQSSARHGRLALPTAELHHIVADGKCRLQVTGATQTIELVAGDFVVVMRDAHILRDAATSTVTDFFELAKRSSPDNKRVFRAGGSGAITKLVRFA